MVCMRVLCEVGSATRERMFEQQKEIEEAMNNTSGQKYFCIQEMLIIWHYIVGS